LARTKSPVQYIVRLGFLQCVATHTHGTRSTCSSEPMNTPFSIVLNIVDKSLWMILGEYRRDMIEEYVPIPANANSWDFLPEPANGRPSFDVMQILTWRDFIALKQTSAKARRFFLTSLRSRVPSCATIRYARAFWSGAVIYIVRGVNLLPNCSLPLYHVITTMRRVPKSRFHSTGASTCR